MREELKERFSELFTLRGPGRSSDTHRGFKEARVYIEQLKGNKENILKGTNWFKSETLIIIDELYTLEAQSVEVYALNAGQDSFDRLYIQLPDDPELSILLMVRLATLKADTCTLVVGENVVGNMVCIRWR